LIISKKRRRLLILAPVLLLAAVLLTNPAGILNRLSSRDPSAAKAASRVGQEVTILGSGDIIVHPQVWAQAAADAGDAHRRGYRFDPMFDQIRGAVSSADLALCHMETPVVDAAPSGFPDFRAPPQIVDAVKHTGWDGCSTDSNHSFDEGEDGVRSTIAVMDRAGLRHTGTYASQAASQVPLIYTVNGVKIAQLSFATMFNENRGHHRPADKPWMANRIGDKDAVAHAARAAKQAGADLVVLSAHWGTEYAPDPNLAQLAQAREFTANPDIDLILGGHSHSVQPIQMINGKWVVFSMGNTLARHNIPDDINRQGILARFTFTKQPDGSWRSAQASVVPIWQGIRPRIEVVNLPRTLSRLTRFDGRRRTYQAAYDRIRDRVLSGGGAAHGLSVVEPAH